MEQKNKEDGMVMIEAIYVLIIAIFLVFFTINLGSIYYNRIIVTSSANEAASGIAEIYGSMGKEPFNAYTPTEHFKGRDIYRHLDKADLKRSAEDRAMWYGSFLVYDKEFSKEKSMDFYEDIDVDCSFNFDIGLQMITVSITREYPVFIFLPAGFWGLDETYEVSATGNAVCYDIIHQMNSMAWEKEIQDFVDSKLWPGIDSILEMVNTIREALSS